MKPLLLHIYLTNRCNSNCNSCNIKALNQKESLNISAILDAARQFKRLGGKAITLTGGEPLLRSDIIEIISAISRLNLNISITTNGIALNREFVDKIKTVKKLRLIISLDSLKRERYKLLRGVDALDKVLKNIEYLRKNVPWKVRVFTTFSEINFEEWSNLINYAKENGLLFSGQPYFFEEKNVFFKYDNKFEIKHSKEIAEIFHNLSILTRKKNCIFGFSKYYEVASNAVKGISFHECGAGNTLLQLTPDNKLRPCNGIDISFSMEKYKIRDIVNDKTWQQTIKKCNSRKACAISCSFSPYLIYKYPLQFIYESVRSGKIMEYLKMLTR